MGEIPERKNRGKKPREENCAIGKFSGNRRTACRAAAEKNAPLESGAKNDTRRKQKQMQQKLHDALRQTNHGKAPA